MDKWAAQGILGLLLVGIPSLSFAIPEYMAAGNAINVNTILRSVYPPNGGAGTMTCTLCHPAGSTISPNTFGAHFRAASMVVTTTIPIRSAAQLTMVFQNTTFINTDSDGDGFDNRSEFVANTVPSSNLSFPGSGATTTTTTTTTTTRIQFPTGGAVASASPDPKGNALSGGCSGGRQQAMIEGPERGERAMVWLGLCVLPMLGLAFRRKE